MTFSILTVCTGNICRSPVAALLLARALGPVETVRVESAGTGALVGAGVPVQAQRLAAEGGVDTTAHRARQLDIGMIRSADLVMAMSREHRRSTVETLPASMRRAFTLRELARIASAAEPQLAEAVANAGATTAEGGMRAGVELAAALRGTIAPPMAPEELDIIDPYRRSNETYVRSYEELAPAAERVASYLSAAASAATRRSPHR